MKKETALLIRKLVVGSLALLIFSGAILSTLHLAFPTQIGLWLVFVVSGGCVAVFIGVIFLLEYYARRHK
ncbi:MAG: hypothetical protein EOM77_05860 [Bacteroidia bacterium]|nr:hypothetical protein [Bacteroidia bacterium]